MRIPSGTPICIVGAGPGGMSAAFFLRSAGYTNITILEKNDQVGGKCHSPTINGVAYDMGALEVTPSYVDVLPLIEKYQLEMTNIGGLLMLDVASGQTYPASYLTKDFSLLKDLALLKDVAKYFLELAESNHALKRPGFHELPAELAMPFGKWLDMKHMSAMRRMFSLPITCYGYGPLDRIAAAYVLKYLDWDDYRMLIGDMIEDRFGMQGQWPKRIVTGYQSLFTHMAADLGSTGGTRILTSAQVTRITRDGSGPNPVQVQYHHDGVPHTEQFGQLILSSLLTADALAFLDQTPAEHALLSQVQVCNYYTTLCDIPGLKRGTYAMCVDQGAIIDPPDGTPCMIIKNWDTGDTVCVYTCSTPQLSVAEVERRVRAGMLRMKLPLGTIHQTIEWPYFPHVGEEALRSGFYEQLTGLMGGNHTWYVGGLMNFEDVQKCFEWSKRIVQDNFVGSAS